MRLRLSDCQSYAVEFEAESLAGFCLELRAALEEFRIERPGALPMLHVWDGRAFIDVGYGRGVRTAVTDPPERLTEVGLEPAWRSALASAEAGREMRQQLDEMVEQVATGLSERDPLDDLDSEKIQ